jgi:hypothetical protein
MQEEIQKAANEVREIGIVANDKVSSGMVMQSEESKSWSMKVSENENIIKKV